MNNKKKRGAYCTDIHFGKKGNSNEHNEDCLRYLKWFISKAQEYEVDYISFLGDWHENRSAINILTLNYSQQGAELLNSVGVPVYMVIGNHDLYYRHSREIFSVQHFNSLKNFNIFQNPTVVKDITDDVLFSPYLFHQEYETLHQYKNVPLWAGHFEFKGFRLTGHSVVMKEGPDHTAFKGPKHIWSGHFHQRQRKDNAFYIGNTFPMDYSDAGDFERGAMIYDHAKQEMFFEDWPDCPKYITGKLSQVLDNQIVMHEQARMRVAIDVQVSYEDRLQLHQKYMTEYNLREFDMIESNDIKQALTETELDQASLEVLEELQEQGTTSTDEIVVNLLKQIQTEQIDNDLLVNIYTNIKT